MNIDNRLNKSNKSNRSNTSNDLPIYYINLDKRVERKHGLEIQAKTQNIIIERYSAYDGMKDKVPKNPNLKRGEYGCWVSHYELWKKVISTNKTSIILEDDIVFGDNFKKELNNILSEARDIEYDILLLDHNWHTNKRPITENICNIGLFYGCQCYIITPKCATYLIDRYNVETVNKPLDVELGRINIQNEIKIIASRCKLVTLGRYSRGSDTNRR